MMTKLTIPELLIIVFAQYGLTYQKGQSSNKYNSAAMQHTIFFACHLFPELSAIEMSMFFHYADPSMIRKNYRTFVGKLQAKDELITPQHNHLKKILNINVPI